MAKMTNKFRSHKGGFDESMATAVLTENNSDILKAVCLPEGTPLRFTHEGRDIRNGWDTFTVNIEVGVIGYSNFNGNKEGE